MVLKKLILALALMIGAFVMAPAPSQAMPLGASAAVETTTPAKVDKVQYYYRRRYRPQYYGYRPYYRPRYRYYRPYNRRRFFY